MLKSRVSKSVLFAALAGLLSGPAAAGEIPYAVTVGSDEQIKGVVSVDDSSGEVTSAKGAASGAVSGELFWTPSAPIPLAQRHSEARCPSRSQVPAIAGAPR